jgi:dynein heavy chain
MEVIRKESAAANKTGAEVSKIATECEANAAFISEQKAIANKELEAAKPALAKAVRAAKSITAKDVKEVTGLKDKMGNIGCYVIDMVSILLHKKMVPCRIPKQKITVGFYNAEGKKEKKEI